ncbi:hypothetical protein JR334_00485 [Clostridia bacterium]|nr:hypothetical protein JR334_00485 [Clostridia bacterium]
MRNKLFIVFCSIFLLVTAMSGCGAKDKVNEAINPAAEMSTETEDGQVASENMKEQAKKEGVSVSELQETLDGLADIGAEKYGITTKEYITQLNSNGGTVLSEWQEASEQMGMSITDLYAYEKDSLSRMTDEQKETMQGMNDALKMAESELEDAAANENTDITKMLGIEENTSGETRTVTMTEEELRQALSYETYKILQDYTDEYSTLYEYVTDASYDDVLEHYLALIVNTKDYQKIEPMGNVGVMLQGTINEIPVYIEIDNSDPGKIRVNNYLDLTSLE